MYKQYACVSKGGVSSSVLKRHFVYPENGVRIRLLSSTIRSWSLDDDRCIKCVVRRAIAKNRYGSHEARIVLAFGLKSYIGP